jgi:hypothetical protein
MFGVCVATTVMKKLAGSLLVRTYPGWRMRTSFVIVNVFFPFVGVRLF